LGGRLARLRSVCLSPGVPAWQVKELGVPYGALQQVADRTVIVDIAVQREDGRPVALQARLSRIIASARMLRRSPG
jgi:hypothetical protein